MTKKHTGPLLDTIKGIDIIDCTQCGFAHINPIPTPEELQKLYNEDYYASEKPLYIKRHREDLDWWEIHYGLRYDYLESVLPEGRRRLLDIGTGPGFFALHGQKRGWEVKAIEPSRQAAAHVRGMGIDVYEGIFEEAILPDLGMFDVVHMSNVLEHIPNPIDFVNWCHQLLRPGGILCIETPNDYSPFQEALRDGCGVAPWWAVPEHHINYFNFNSLNHLLSQHGFDVVHAEASFPMEMFLLMGKNYLGNDSVGRACHALRKSFEKNLVKADKKDLLAQLYTLKKNQE